MIPCTLKTLWHYQKRTITTQHNSCMPALVITLYCEPFGIISVSMQYTLIMQNQSYITTVCTPPTMILLLNTGKITKK